MLLNIIVFIVGVIFGFGFAVWSGVADVNEEHDEEN